MSESPKMGLFGSKDETNETKQEVKDDSPDRYAPYCIDSDSETYDTEALSIMDINDIIGVQSEPVSDSTLESEIAALSQIITESKTDGSQNIIEDKFEKQEENMSEDQKASKETNECLKSVVQNLNNVCTEETTCDNDVRQLSEECSQLNNKNTLFKNMEFKNQQKDCETTVLTDSISVTNKTDVFSQSSSDHISLTLEAAKKEETVITSSEDQQDHNVEISILNNEVITVKTDNGIRGSLQLIGEAYSSEDSQDMSTNDIEPHIIATAVTSNESCLIHKEEKKETSDSYDTLDNLNSVPEMSDSINLSKVCTNKNIPFGTVENKVHNMEVDTSNISEECRHTEELSSALEKTENIVPNEYEVDSVDLESKKEEINVDLADMDVIKAEGLQKEKDGLKLGEGNEIMEYSEMEINKKSIELVDDTCVPKDEKHETKMIVGHIETAEHGTEIVKENIVTEIIKGNTEIKEYETEVVKEDIEMDIRKVENIEENTTMEKQEMEIVEKNTEAGKYETKIVEENTEVKKHETKIIEENTETEIHETEIAKENTETEIHETQIVKGNTEMIVPETEIVEGNTEVEIQKLEIIEENTEVEKDNTKMEVVEESTDAEIHEIKIAEENTEVGNHETKIVEENAEMEIVEENTEMERNETKVVQDNTDAEKHVTKIVEKNTETKQHVPEIVKSNIEMEVPETEIMEENPEVENHKTEIIKRNTEVEKHETEIVKGNIEMEKHEIKIVEENIEMDKHRTNIVDGNTKEVRIHKSDILEEHKEMEIHSTEMVEDNIESDTHETNIVKDDTKEMEIHSTETVEGNSEMDNLETDIVEENLEVEKDETELVRNTKIEKHETDIIERIDIEEEWKHDSKKCIPEENIMIQENKESVNILNVQINADDNNLLDIELNDKVNINNDAVLTQKENKLKTESTLCPPENINDFKVGECQQLNSQDIKNNSDALKLPQEKEELNIGKLEIIKEVQENSLKPLTSQLSSQTSDKDSVTFGKNSALDSQIIIELPLQTENLVNNAANVVNAEINIDIQTEDGKGQNPMSSETETKEPSNNEPVEAMELSITEDKPEDELKTCTSVISDTTSDCDAQMEVDSVVPVVESLATSNITMSIDTNTDENSVTNTKSMKIEECISEEQSEELKDVQNRIIEETETKETLNTDDIIEQHTEFKDIEIVEKGEDIDPNLSEETTIDVQSTKDKDESSFKILVKPEESLETETSTLRKHEDICKSDDKRSPEQLIEDNTTAIQCKTDVKIKEIKESITSDDQISDIKSVPKDSLLSPSDCTEILIPDEGNAEEEGTEEELNLTSEPDEVELQSGMNRDDPKEDSEKENVTEIIEEICKESEPTPVVEMNDANTDSLNIEKLNILDTNAEKIINLDSTEDSMVIEDVNKNQELSNKQHIEDSDSKSDEDGNNLKNILDTSNNTEEMFTGEQSQNTEDIVTSILDDVRSATDFKNILTTEVDVANEMETVFQQSADLPSVEAEMEELTEKLPHDSEDILNKDMEDTISTQNMDSLEGLLGLDLIPEGEDATLKTMEPEEQTQEELTSPKDVDMTLLLEQSNDAPDVAQASDYITDVISSCLTDSNTLSLEDNIEKNNTIEAIDDKTEESEASNVLKVNDIIISTSMNKDDNVENLQKELDADTGLPVNELDIDFEETPLESVDDLEETESKLELAQDILLSNVDQSENLNDASACVETSQPSSEISELESAVKFLQESEEQTIDSPLALSSKLVESVVHDITKQADTSSLFVPDEEMCEDASELVVELENIETDSISISEAEIISEAAKLESERKLAEQIKLDAAIQKFENDDDKLAVDEEKIKIFETDVKFDEDSSQNVKMQQTLNVDNKRMIETMSTLPRTIFKVSETIPKVSILEERLKEPPKIEIPPTDVTKVLISPTTSKDSLLIPKDAKLIAYQKMLESPKLSERLEPKITETPRKDSEKHDFENVGSPRIILKIAKSAITDCGEPRSPKSPKIRSATNSPNPEDSPGQKLGKIKLKLSKSGHPSIISNENIEEMGQWYSEGSLSLSPIGMKIKLSKSGDVSIVSSEKHEADDSKETKHKFEEAKRTESPIGMKIKLSKSGDASIVQQDAKDMQIKHKEKLDIVQGSPKRTESPIGMKIKLSKTGDASIIQPERHDAQEDHREAQLRPKEKLEASYDSPKRMDSPIGMKIKLSKTGDASIVSPDVPDEGKDTSKIKDKVENSSPEIPKRTESPMGMKIKLAMTKGGASIISMENPEDTKEKLEIPDVPKRTESPLGMKIKLSKTGDASIVHSEISDEGKETKQKEKLESKEKLDTQQDTTKASDTSSAMKRKIVKSIDTTIVAQESTKESEIAQEASTKVESPIGMKIKLSKFGDPSIVPTDKQEQLEEPRLHQETSKRTESPIGMKFKLSKTGDASIIQSEVSEDINKTIRSDAEHSKTTDAALGMKIKLLKTGDASIVDTEKKERQLKRRDTESPLEMKIKLSKTGHPTIVACDTHAESTHRTKEVSEQTHSFTQRFKESTQAVHKEPALKILKTGHSTILQSNRSELTIEPVQASGKKADSVVEISPKRKEVTIAPIEPKKSKLEAQLTQILPEVTIQPVASRDQKQFLFDTKSSAISLQQMNVISQEISITQVRPSKSSDTSMSEKLKDILAKNTTGSPMNSDCEIIEHRPELIIVNENSNSSQDVVIIEEVPPTRMPEVKVPKKRGRPRRNPLVQAASHPPPHLLLPRDPLSLDEAHQKQQPQVPLLESRENERPKRTCRSQKSYAPPKRGRGRGRGKRKLDIVDLQMIKQPRMEQDLTAIEASTMAVITIDDPPVQQQSFGKSPELYKVLKQPAMDAKIRAEKKAGGQKNDARKGTPSSSTIVHLEAIKVSDVRLEATTVPEVRIEATKVPEIRLEVSKIPEIRLDVTKMSEVRLESSKAMPKPVISDSKDSMKDKKLAEVSSEKMQKTTLKSAAEEKSDKTTENAKSENKETLVPPEHLNWLTPTSKRPAESAGKHENMSTVQVIDEETRMSAESGSRSQTPARNISAPASETIVNEESQGSVLSTATTESEKVKVKNRRMEINFDPDEGPFTVDKIAEYEWPLDRKGETIMIQEQISQYLGVKSFKRKYPDLKRRVVDMEERNYLRENGLVSEAMCDMGLTAICSSEVLDVMCSDFPDQYEEYRKHMREKQVKEHSKKQKELTAAANAEKNRIDLAEMAVQSALSWNISLNKARRENRKCSLDLQTFTLHVPKKQQKVETERKVGHYPVALIPGQYTDYYREYTPAELRYYPLNTVLYGPMRPNERKFDSQSEGSQSDSDSDSSSDDSSEGTQDTEGSQSTMDEVDMEIVNQKEEVKLKCKMCLKTLNKLSKNEILIQCGTCNGHVHPSCIDLTLDMVPHIQSYAWQCTDCKTCAQCHDPADEDKMLFCDMCDRGYHIYCVGLRRVPQGRWHCQECAVCANCSSREPGGVNSDRNSVAQWQHEYKKGDKNTRVYVSTLCVPCSKLWRKGRYCPHCSRCHTAPRLDLEANLVHCSACDKYLHLGCVETKGMPLDRKSYLCDFCAPNRQQVVKPLVSKTLRT
ncbi:PHD finger protein enhancer of yellow 3 isoform X2 [Colletes latitarsis]|uniref:PHD finger protein enhancer of yellow 3 isoform X2 n=1 Tax=Colletes latitarsis TaxID=2605962 RepID=UPI004035F12C